MSGGGVVFFGLMLAAALGWQKLRARRQPPEPPPEREPAPARITLASGAAFDVLAHLQGPHGMPILAWEAANEAAAAQARPAEALEGMRRAWLLHLRDALGEGFHLHASAQAIVLSSLDPATVRTLLAYVAATRSRILRVLQGIARFEPGDKSVLLVLDDEDSYYQYVAAYDPQGGEFGFSSGMFISHGCPHFVVKRQDLPAIEAVIAHELTHSALAHLRLPTWIDEGLAVNTEHRLAGAKPGLHSAQQLHARHVAFWDAARIQEFWSGRSFFRSDDGQLLSYELARILVQQLARDWAPFAAFAQDANRDDAGHDAARRLLGLDLGTSVRTLFGKDDDDWTPDRARWEASTAA